MSPPPSQAGVGLLEAGHPGGLFRQLRHALRMTRQRRRHQISEVADGRQARSTSDGWKVGHGRGSTASTTSQTEPGASASAMISPGTVRQPVGDLGIEGLPDPLTDDALGVVVATEQPLVGGVPCNVDDANGKGKGIAFCAAQHPLPVPTLGGKANRLLIFPGSPSRSASIDATSHKAA